MRYRLEDLDDVLHIRNVDADVIVGTIEPYTRPNPRNPNLCLPDGGAVYDNDGKEVDACRGEVPLMLLAHSVASREEYRGYPSFKNAKGPVDPYRVEWLLGKVLADAATEICRSMIEHDNGGVKAETKKKFVTLITQLHAIWYVSLFGSVDDERRVVEPYFAATPPWNPRMTFAAAARHYGTFELACRFPDEPEAALQKVLVLPLTMLELLLKRLVPITKFQCTEI